MLKWASDICGKGQPGMQTEQYEVTWKNYYSLFELGPTANAQEIKRAYWRLAHKHHPDRAEDSLASARMAEINEAYEVLADADRRTRYDQRYQALYGTSRKARYDGRSKARYGRGSTAEEASQAGLTIGVIIRLAREWQRHRWMKRLVPLPINVEPTLFFAWLVYVLLCIVLLLVLSLPFSSLAGVP